MTTDPFVGPAAISFEFGQAIPLIPEPILRRYDCYEPNDTRFQSVARLLQAIWREEQGFPIGRHRSRNGKARRMGSRLNLRDGCAGANFLLPAIAALVRREVAYREIGAAIETDRLYRNLLSSAPLAFNLFALLKLDTAFATQVLRLAIPDFAGTVTQILFEHSPGRGHPAFTADFTAFDVLIRYRTDDGRRGFIAVEQKYSETLNETAQPTRPHFDALSHESALYEDPNSATLRINPCQQLWREHLLAASMIQRGLYDEGAFVVIAPRLNWYAQNGIAAYARHLKKPGNHGPGFVGMYLERFIEAIGTAGAPEFAQRLHQRYCNFARIDQIIDAYLEAEDHAGNEPPIALALPASVDEARAA